MSCPFRRTVHDLTRGSLSTSIVQEIPARRGATDSVPNGAKLHTGCHCQAADSPGDGGGQGGCAAVGVQSLQRASPGAAFQACHDDAAGCLPAAGPPSGGCFAVVLKGGGGGGGGAMLLSAHAAYSIRHFRAQKTGVPRENEHVALCHIK